MGRVEEVVFIAGRQAKNASRLLAMRSSEDKNAALVAIAKSLDEKRSSIKAQNQIDIREGISSGLSSSVIDRLTLSDQRIDDMIRGVHAIAALSDPIGKLITSKTLKNGIELKKVRVPIGVVGIIFESRPNVVVDVAALCLKSGNAVILRGGKEAQNTNLALMSAIDDGLQKIAFAPFAVQMIQLIDRAAITHLCRLDGLVDLIIPRGGEGLINAIKECATVPVIKHYKGVCHVFVDRSADFPMALAICENAKCQRPGVCNAVETILIHQSIAHDFLPKLAARFDHAGVQMRGCERSRAITKALSPATPEDWSTEYLDLIVSIKVVAGLDEAIDHINTYGSHHSDAIITEDREAKLRFAKEVDSAAVYVNASTRFTDGAMFGLGAEMGISTDKLHARGPMGLEELTTYKWVGLGSGQIRIDGDTGG